MSMDSIRSHAGIMKKLPPSKRKAYRERLRYWRQKSLSLSGAHEKAARPVLHIVKTEIDRLEESSARSVVDTNLSAADDSNQILESPTGNWQKGQTEANLPAPVGRYLPFLPSLMSIFVASSKEACHV